MMISQTQLHKFTPNTYSTTNKQQTNLGNWQITDILNLIYGWNKYVGKCLESYYSMKYILHFLFNFGHLLLKFAFKNTRFTSFWRHLSHILNAKGASKRVISMLFSEYKLIRCQVCMISIDFGKILPKLENIIQRMIPKLGISGKWFH